MSIKNDVLKHKLLIQKHGTYLSNTFVKSVRALNKHTSVHLTKDKMSVVFKSAIDNLFNSFLEFAHYEAKFNLILYKKYTKLNKKIKKFKLEKILSFKFPLSLHTAGVSLKQSFYNFVNNKINYLLQLQSDAAISKKEVKSELENGVVIHNCMLSHGSVQFLKERTFDCSDKYYIWVDQETGMISPVNPQKGIYKSLYSDNTTKFSKVQIPYSSKLLIQELMSMCIVPRLKTTN